MAYLPFSVDSSKNEKRPVNHRPKTAAEIKGRPLATRQRISSAKEYTVLKRCIGDPKHYTRQRRLTLTDAIPGIGDLERLLKKLNFSLIERDANLKVLVHTYADLPTKIRHRVGKRILGKTICLESGLLFLYFPACVNFNIKGPLVFY